VDVVKRRQTDDETFNKFQYDVQDELSGVSSTLNELNAHPLLGGVIMENLDVTASGNTYTTTLPYNINGVIVIRNDSSAVIFTPSLSGRSFTIQTNPGFPDTASVDVYVF